MNININLSNDTFLDIYVNLQIVNNLNDLYYKDIYFLYSLFSIVVQTINLI